MLKLKLQTRLQYGSLLLLAPLLLSACSSSSTTPPVTAEDIQRGACPDSIVNPQQMTSEHRRRYGDKVDSGKLLNYQKREIANCEGLLDKGNVPALYSLIKHAEGNAKRRAGYMELYLERGQDTRASKEAATYLYRLYRSGGGNVTQNPSASFKYLGIAVNNGAQALTLPYADELYARNLYTDAFPLYYALADNSPASPSRFYSREELCEANYKLADLYYSGLGTKENWYLGYYFWETASEDAQSAQWGSCRKENFLGGDIYTLERQRLKRVQPRSELLTDKEVRRIDAIMDRQGSGALPYVAALNFAPRNAPDIKTTARLSPKTSNHALPIAWTPLRGGICQSVPAQQPLPWSTLFERRATAVWTVNSSNGQSASQGSAIAVSANHLITNCHLINNPQDIRLRRGHNTVGARLAAADTAGDRCILQVGQPMLSYASTSRSHDSIKIGEDVAAIGNPKGLDTSLSRGIVGQKRSKNGIRYLQTDAAISSGSSGGGLFDRAGNLVGITSFTVAEGENLNFAIAAEDFCRN